MLERREITRDTLRPLLQLALKPAQAHLVAPNPVTIAQAAYEPGGAVWGLWDGALAVGLLAMLDPGQAILQDGDVPGAAIIWRLMIGAQYQGRGYGRAAISQAAEQARDWRLPRLATSVVDAPDANIGFYEHLGFRRTGDIVDDEIVLEKRV